MSSLVVLNSIALDIDPDNYMLLGGKRRGSVHKTVDGSTVFQDRGFDETDGIIQLSGQLTSVETVKSLLTLYKLTAKSFTFTDFKNNQYTVVFTPGEESLQVLPIRGSNIGYTYKIMLSIVSVVKRFDEAGEYPTSE